MREAVDAVLKYPFLEYFPYSHQFVGPIIKQLKEQLLTLDIDLGGACNKRCRNCDTPCYDSPLSLEASDLEPYINEVRGIYVCGKGEPSFAKNGQMLHEICKMAEKSGAIVSTFSNIAELPSWMLQFIDSGVLHVLFKLDTLDKDKMLWFQQEDHYDQTIKHLNQLKEVVHVKNGTTNLAASLVPMKFNIDEMSSLVEFCLENNFYPNIGELEEAGVSVGETFQDLSVSQAQLAELQRYMTGQTGHDYKCPICPGVFGVHIDNIGDIVVDEKTALSCCWFWNDNPRMNYLGNIKSNSFQQISQRVIGARHSKIDEVKKLIASGGIENQIFGGCGGNVSQLLSEYIHYFA